MLNPDFAKANPEFASKLERYRVDESAGRQWIYVPYDQLTEQVGPICKQRPKELGVILVESRSYYSRRPYHQAKLALLIANQRQFALEQAKRGVAIQYLTGDQSIADQLTAIADAQRPLTMMAPAERELSVELEPLQERSLLHMAPNETWLTTFRDFTKSTGDKPPYRMDTFYRYVRKRYKVLFDGKPIGGKWSFDTENRQRWQGTPIPPSLPQFRPDKISQEAFAWVKSVYHYHPGDFDPQSIPTTAADAAQCWEWAKLHCLPNFGPFEDAMTVESSTLFHTRLSALINISRLLPRDLIREAESTNLPISSKEGFIRQILGWREFVKHVHQATDGFRQGLSTASPTADSPGDGGYECWKGAAWIPDRPTKLTPPTDGGACPNYLSASTPLPQAYWGTETGLKCLDHVVQTVWAEGWSHHITRLMILSNIATLLGCSPRELTDWFWIAYVDAYDWVVEPNVLAMGTYAAGGVMTTKPYVCGAAYIKKMSDYCGKCQFNPQRTCPITRLYWAFLEQQKEHLQNNPRMSMIYRTLAKRSQEDKAKDKIAFEAISDLLQAGQKIPLDILESI